MTQVQVSYLVFGIVLVLAIIIDLGLFSKRSTIITIKKAFWISLFWVALGLSFGIFIWFELGEKYALEYISAYLMEKSLSIDNIFVFILIFGFFNVKEIHYARVLLIGILMAILLRVLFISIGIELIERFEWLLYVFGGILLFTGVKMFTAKGDEQINLEKNKVYMLMKKFVPLVADDGEGKFRVRINKKLFYTSTFVVVIMLATTDIIFALDSIPAVFAISQHPLVIYTSNIFAVLGLRSLFFLLKGAANRFKYLQQGIAIVLIFIGLKMLVVLFDIHIPVYISLIVILVCIVASILYSIQVANKEEEGENI